MMPPALASLPGDGLPPLPAEEMRRSRQLAGLGPLRLAQIEARAPGMTERLGAAIGRTPNRRPRYMPAEEGGFGYGTPCPFLAEGECSVYEHRPFACRKHHGLDVDALFCRLDLPAEFAASVPWVSPNMALLAYAAAVTPSMGVADIRDWFPGPREIARGPVGRIASVRHTLEALQAKEASWPKT